MRPGQMTPNDFELAILECVANQDPSMRDAIPGLHVLSREFTGVGSFTTFTRSRCENDSTRRAIDLDALIRIPSAEVELGAVLLGAVLFCDGQRLDCLEVFSFDGPWDGVYEGFSIEPNLLQRTQPAAKS